MPSLRDLRDRIGSVKSTRKITSAMKLVATSKLKKAQEAAEASQPYAVAMSQMITRVAANVQITPTSSPLLRGTGKRETHLVLVVSADRGLCGGFNSFVARKALQHIEQLERDKRAVKIVCVGRKARDVIARTHKEKIVQSFTGIGGKTKIGFDEAHEISEYLLVKFSEGEFDICSLVYNEFVSVLTQKPKVQQLIPFKLPEAQAEEEEAEEEAEIGPKPLYTFEPDEEQILNDLLPRNIAVQIYRTLLDSAAGEQAARMTAMDSATRNAGDMIKDLTLQYNRARQAFITKELIEIISGAEAL